MQEGRTEQDLRAWLRDQKIEATLHDHLPSVHTVAEAAEVMGVPEAAVAKSVIFVNDGEPVVVLAPGDAKVRDRYVIDHVGGARNRFRLARPAEVLEWTGYPVGGVPPFGHTRTMRTLMDERLFALDKALFGGGSDAALLEVAPAVVRETTRAELGRFAD
ncbi:MAG: YbaK/EbsC family protein [Euryarchaeota archaeon]|nr:YbaK/EbsC family protein [Euryarchaeota archaeon]